MTRVGYLPGKNNAQDFVANLAFAVPEPLICAMLVACRRRPGRLN
jgi:hypothetical protein